MDEARYRQAEGALFRDAGIDPTERWVTLASTGTRARVLEVGEGMPVLFLHGGPNAAATWSYLAAATEGVRCLLLDRPGTGLSEPPPEVPGVDDLPRYVARLTADVLDGLGVERASLVGSSFGGYSALRSAAALAERVDRVVLVGYPAFVPGWRAPSFFTLLRTPLLGRLLVAAPPTRWSARLSLRQLGHRRSLAAGRIPPAMLDWTLAWQRRTATMRNDAAMIVALGTWRGGFDERLDLTAGDLAAVPAPCLLVAGSDDPVGAAAEGRHLRSLLPDASLEVLEGAGHLPWLDDPARVAALVSAWVRAGPAPRTGLTPGAH